jgi:hypothetical protein
MPWRLPEQQFHFGCTPVETPRCGVSRNGNISPVMAKTGKTKCVFCVSLGLFPDVLGVLRRHHSMASLQGAFDEIWDGINTRHHPISERKTGLKSFTYIFRFNISFF